MESLEKGAYAAYEAEAGLGKPWERLTEKEQAGWRAVVELLVSEDPDFDAEIECECGHELVCPTCDGYVPAAAVAAEAGPKLVEAKA